MSDYPVCGITPRSAIRALSKLSNQNMDTKTKTQTPEPATGAGTNCAESTGSVPTGIEAYVCADIARRQALGIAKYGKTVAENPLRLREWLQHAYEETLDNAVYLRRAIVEIDARQNEKLTDAGPSGVNKT